MALDNADQDSPGRESSEVTQHTALPSVREPRRAAESGTGHNALHLSTEHRIYEHTI